MARESFRFSTPLRVRWSECDQQGIVFNGAYMAYLEVAHAEYYRRLGLNLYRLGELNLFDVVMSKVDMEFKSPVRVDQLLELFLRIGRIGTTSMTMDLEIFPAQGFQLLTTARAIQVSYDRAAQRSRPVPEEIRELVAHFESTGEVLPLSRYPRLMSGGA